MTLDFQEALDRAHSFKVGIKVTLVGVDHIVEIPPGGNACVVDGYLRWDSEGEINYAPVGHVAMLTVARVLPTL